MALEHPKPEKNFIMERSCDCHIFPLKRTLVELDPFMRCMPKLRPDIQ